MEIATLYNRKFIEKHENLSSIDSISIMNLLLENLVQFLTKYRFGILLNFISQQSKSSPTNHYSPLMTSETQ